MLIPCAFAVGALKLAWCLEMSSALFIACTPSLSLNELRFRHEHIACKNICPYEQRPTVGEVDLYAARPGVVRDSLTHGKTGFGCILATNTEHSVPVVASISSVVVEPHRGEYATIDRVVKSPPTGITCQFCVNASTRQTNLSFANGKPTQQLVDGAPILCCHHLR